MEQTKMETIYHELVKESEDLIQNSDLSRLEALGEALLKVATTDATLMDKRKAFQFAYLYHAQKEQIQPNHQITPDSIGYVINLIIDLFISDEETRLLDVGSGLGHLSTTVLEQHNSIDITGVEVDPTLTHICANLCEFLESPMTLIHQNAVEQMMLDPVDFVIGDLPIGYYPLEVSGFKTAFDNQKSFAHLLLLENGMNYVKQDGIGVFVVPSNVLEENNETIKNYLSEDSTLLMFLNLPKSIFRNEANRKSIMVLKKGYTPLKNNEVLIGEIPDFKNQNALNSFIKQLKTWYGEYIKK